MCFYYGYLNFIPGMKLPITKNPSRYAKFFDLNFWATLLQKLEFSFKKLNPTVFEIFQKPMIARLIDACHVEEA